MMNDARYCTVDVISSSFESIELSSGTEFRTIRKTTNFTHFGGVQSLGCTSHLTVIQPALYPFSLIWNLAMGKFGLIDDFIEYV